METAVPAAPPVGTDEGDVLPGVGPNHLIPLHFHILSKAVPVDSVLQRFVDGLDQVQLPAVPTEAGLILSGRHPLSFGLLLRYFQNAQAIGSADFIVGLTVGQQVIRTLVELLPVDTTDAVDYQMVVEVVGVHMGGDHDLEAGKFSLGQLQWIKSKIFP